MHQLHTELHHFIIEQYTVEKNQNNFTAPNGGDRHKNKK